MTTCVYSLLCRIHNSKERELAVDYYTCSSTRLCCGHGVSFTLWGCETSKQSMPQCFRRSFSPCFTLRHPIPSDPIWSHPISSHPIPSHGIRPGCMSLSGSSCLQPALQAIWQKLLNYSWQFANLSWNGWLGFVFFGFVQFTSWFHCFVAAASRCSPFLCFRVPFFLFVYFSLHEIIDRQTVNPLDPVMILFKSLEATCPELAVLKTGSQPSSRLAAEYSNGSFSLQEETSQLDWVKLTWIHSSPKRAFKSG